MLGNYVFVYNDYILILKGFSHEDDSYEHNERPGNWFNCNYRIHEMLWKSQDNILEVRVNFSLISFSVFLN